MAIARVWQHLLSALAILTLAAAARADEKTVEAPIRAGIIGLDTSHAVAFTDLFMAADAAPELKGIMVVAAYPGGSPDLPASINRLQDFTAKLKERGVEIVDSIPALLAKVDVVLLESVDGRKHLEQVRPVFEAGKRVFIDKPLAASLADAIAIDNLARKHNVAWFSASALRYSAISPLASDRKVGEIIGCDAWSPCDIDPTHPDLFWYGIHGVEMLYTLMGSGCVSVSRATSADTDVVIGVWSDGRIGTFRGLRKGTHDYGATVFGTKAVASSTKAFKGYEPLVIEIARFFKTGKPPVAPQHTLEIIAFMEAAEESKRQGGKPVTTESVMEKAKEEAAKR